MTIIIEQLLRVGCFPPESNRYEYILSKLNQPLYVFEQY